MNQHRCTAGTHHAACDCREQLFADIAQQNLALRAQLEGLKRELEKQSQAPNGTAEENRQLRVLLAASLEDSWRLDKLNQWARGESLPAVHFTGDVREIIDNTVGRD